MEFIPKEEQRRIFRNELYNLKEKGYVTNEEYKKVSEAHNEYFSSILAREQKEKESAINEQSAKTAIVQPVSEKEMKVQVTKMPVKVKPKKTSEEIRERNISWSLNIGVIMLLIGGLFVATSNWETMTPWMKAGSIALVSALFYGIAFVSYRMLKIEKTAFAFVVLGSLFFPIFTLSLGWFELLGSTLSFNGEGRFILGFISSSVLIPVYTLLAEKLSSRLFVWFAFIGSTAAAAYLLRAIGLDADGFYLGLMIYNSLLIAGYHYLKKKELYTLFTKELAFYSQANLILSTLLMLIFFENHFFYGFNLIMTAAIYLSMIFVNGRKEYHFVFSAMIVFGAYQILENWNFREASVIGYALLGFVFLLLPKFIKDQFGLKRVFQLTSAVVSGLAFIMITAEGILLHSQNPSLTLFAAYMLIAVNFIYLANTHKSMIFCYLSPIFLAAALFEAVMKLHTWVDFPTLILPIYFIGFILFTVFGWKLKVKKLRVIQNSSRDVGMVIMFFMMIVSFAMLHWQELGIKFFLTGILFYLMLKIESRSFLPLFAQWAAPISVGLSVAAFCEEIRSHSSIYDEFTGIPGNFAIAGLLLLAISFILKNFKEIKLAESTFYSSHCFYAAALFFTFTAPISSVIGESLVWLGGILMSIILFKTTKDVIISYLTGIIGLVWYIITLNSINEEFYDLSATSETFLFLGGGWLLLGAAAMLLQKEKVLATGLAWVAHVYLAPALILSYVIYEQDGVWSYLVATGVYISSLLFVKQEWKVKAILYGAFTTLFLSIKTGLIYFSDEDFGYYAFLATSILIGIFWFTAKESFKLRTVYYLVPFSLLGIASFMVTYPYSWLLFGMTVLYAVGTLFLLHRIKWDLLKLLPLLMIFYASIQLIYQSRIDVLFEIVLLAAFGVSLLIAGGIFYSNLWENGSVFGLKSLDSYTIVSFFFIVSISVFKTETFWAQIVHGLLMSGAFWLQRKRVHIDLQMGFTFIAGAYLLVPYYASVEQLNIPALWLWEVNVLPFVALVIFLRFVTKGKWETITGYIEWAILIIVSLVLIRDGLTSNTIYDALILGSLSLISMLAGMWLRVKAYFFVGAGVLLLNVILQTRPFWGNLPWWGYLLIGGSILIAVASFNEWNKQKGAKGEKTFIMTLREKFSSKFKTWN
ncbi:hypothetical protein AABM38_13455 [Heyndrickxia sp. MSNUG]|uniref:hypothetical protein n=1 Tax=Heyndrickxia sp. MSNUG TaxID=3136677 RepID=UPI003C30D8B8